MVFRFDREKKAFVDKERKLLFKEAGVRGRWDEGPFCPKYRFQIEGTEFIRQEIIKKNDIFYDWSEERDKYNMRKYTIRLGGDPWVRILYDGLDRISGSAPWTYETEIMYREAIYAFYTEAYGDHIDKINIQFGTSGYADSLESFVPSHPVYEAED